MISAEAVAAAAYALYVDANPDTEVQWFDISFHDQDELMRTATKALEAAAPHMLADLTKNSPRLPSALRNVVFEAVFDVVDKFHFPAQNCGYLPGVVEIGDVCGDVEKRILAILRASALTATP